MQPDNSIRIFDGAVAIVTGGASGIGQALSETLARRRAEVVIADLQTERAERVAEGIRAQGGKASVAGVDVTDFPAMKQLVEDTVAVHGRLDYLFNNAGIAIAGEARRYTLEDWNRVVDVNLLGVIHGVQAAYAVMLRQGFGHFVNTASIAGLVPSPWGVGYTATKHAVVGLSLALRVEATQAGVRVSVLCPGVVRTPILENGGTYGKLLQPVPADRERLFWERLRPMDPGKFAEQVLNAVARNRAIIIVPRWWRFFWWLNRVSPALGQYLGRRYLLENQRAVAEPPATPLLQPTGPASRIPVD
jgi:NAD(P)-dependent dehydrogenase (short-subunit alcohol dehydrogenase family)